LDLDERKNKLEKEKEQLEERIGKKEINELEFEKTKKRLEEVKLELYKLWTQPLDFIALERNNEVRQNIREYELQSQSKHIRFEKINERTTFN